MMGKEEYGEGKRTADDPKHNNTCQTRRRKCYGMGRYGCQPNELTAVLVRVSHLISTQYSSSPVPEEKLNAER